MESNCPTLFHMLGSLQLSVLLWWVVFGCLFWGFFFAFCHFFTSLSKNTIQNKNLKCKLFDLLELKPAEVWVSFFFFQGYIILPLKM